MIEAYILHDEKFRKNGFYVFPLCGKKEGLRKIRRWLKGLFGGEIMNKNYMWKTIIVLAIGICFWACSHPFEYHPYELNLQKKYKHINERNIQRLKAQDRNRDTVRFIMMGDTQRWYDETEDFVKEVNERNDIDFVIHGGDISDFGLKKEFCWIHDIMSRLKVPYVAIIGNHDNLGSGEEVYQVMYGALNFSFIYSGIKFLCLNTNALEYDYSIPVPDFVFIEEQIADTAYYHSSVVAMHVPPESVLFNNNVAKPFQDYIKRLTNLRFCLHAHAHHLMETDFFLDGILYYGSDAMVHRNYLLFTVTPNSYTYEVVYF